MRKQRFLVAAVVAIGFLGFGLVAARPAQQPPEVSAASEIINLQFPKLVWSDERIISSKLPGRIQSRFVNDGAAVKAGDVLAELDLREAKLEDERQQLVAKSDLLEKIARATYEEYQARSDANDRLIKSRSISYDEWRLGIVQVLLNGLKVEQEVEKTKIEKNKAKQTELILGEHIIQSPINGRIQKCFKREHEQITPNELQLFRIVATDKLWAEGLVPARYAFRVKEGQRVTVQLVFQDEIDSRKIVHLPQSDEVFEGRIIFIDPDVNDATQLFSIRAEVENRDDLLRAGFKCTMKIHLQ